jgi:hypothetical protein
MSLGKAHDPVSGRKCLVRVGAPANGWFRRTGARAPPLRNRKFADSPLEGNGFEISVPRCLATANSVDAFNSAGEWRLLEPPKQLYRFSEAPDRSGDSAAAPTIDRPQPDRSHEAAAYLARN